MGVPWPPHVMHGGNMHVSVWLLACQRHGQLLGH
ncbi:hypothetical protein MAR_026585 [Mya arenaria]|uniref:Uncharacterized protein n=1 Tax=Mya arenaria TaxID=6604 RepID=A0ABY7ERD5_MYAAR|nr:hypothetical protein MAR_026549 [Mya arenaria]WAR12405.1 hypothetical protein MAR_026585 [Mya arenaria]